MRRLFNGHAPDVSDKDFLIDFNVCFSNDIKLIKDNVGELALELDSEFHLHISLQVSLCCSEVYSRLHKLDLKNEFLIVSVLFSDLRVEPFEESCVDSDFVRAKMMHDPVSINFKFEPFLALHGLHDTIGDAIAHDELEVLALVVVLEVVVVLVGRHQAVVGLGSNVCKEGEVELMVVDLRISSETPIQQKVARFIYLRDL